MKNSTSLTTSIFNLIRPEVTDHLAYRNFINSLRSRYTKDAYSIYLNRFLNLPQYKNKTLDEILQTNPKELEADIIEHLIFMKDNEGLSHSSLSLFLAALSHFFTINDVLINRKKISKFIGEHENKQEYRPYNLDEISKLLSLQDERGRVCVLLMASTGMRVGALPHIRLKHLKRWNIANTTKDFIYQITVYGNSPKSKYLTFCTPETAKAIDEYLDMRKRHGESSLKIDENGNWIPGDTALIIRQFNKQLNTALYSSKTSILPSSITEKVIIHKLHQLGIREKIHTTETMSQKEAPKIRHELHPCHSLRIFAITQMQRAKVDKTIREMLVGHSTGLDKVYYKPQDEEILQEYLKAVDLLTISNEHRLQKQVDYYKERESDLSRMSFELAEIREKLGI
ncbi:site-specific integrase [Candidatus Nitrosocosmicus sp. SS]|uniref:site-specific integrase n=1 Tax=Candidatus Nitrosocosmicus agrestis TaxID=2563600 RepID=UPI00122E926E|nr:site-specific integrase [Candidatus Nitrosocosmicus sp. SS]KAA2281229.1 site-specific integrase [Candidatus Nitrosocosmicus sp. SS]KAF0868356.1 site-specific integrase [Candidatus Nitrosocosmicus sp. SS]MDR4490505.1 site-specific integrase [Candidatus Nitrosocosmicus sp.]